MMLITAIFLSTMITLDPPAPKSPRRPSRSFLRRVCRRARWVRCWVCRRPQRLGQSSRVVALGNRGFCAGEGVPPHHDRATLARPRRSIHFCLLCRPHRRTCSSRPKRIRSDAGSSGPTHSSRRREFRSTEATQGVPVQTPWRPSSARIELCRSPTMVRWRPLLHGKQLVRSASAV